MIHKLNFALLKVINKDHDRKQHILTPNKISNVTKSQKLKLLTAFFPILLTCIFCQVVLYNLKRL